ncbi:hypothetical protein BGS_0265 [Beggiatoa sp. SS]|nr:hypothetical protein BGS_0265 [Beggiatoa sp. SS]
MINSVFSVFSVFSVYIFYHQKSLNLFITQEAQETQEAQGLS